MGYFEECEFTATFTLDQPVVANAAKPYQQTSFTVVNTARDADHWLMTKD